MKSYLLALLTLASTLRAQSTTIDTSMTKASTTGSNANVTVVLGQPKNVPFPPAPKTLAPGTQPTADVLARIRSAKPSTDALAKQNAEHPIVHHKAAAPVRSASLGLDRLEGRTKKGGTPPLNVQEFEIDPLNVPTGVKSLARGQQKNTTFLAMEPRSEWSRPLRGDPRDIKFVSLNIHASATTVVQVGGAWLCVLPSERNASHVAVVAGMPDDLGNMKWRRPLVETSLEVFGGRQMGALPILTIRLDPDAGTWDIYSGGHMIAIGLPLVSQGKGKPPAHELVVRAGSDGAWLNAVALADANPLFADANLNGIDDAYELAKNGALLPTRAPASQRTALASQWLKDGFKPGIVPVFARRPVPDRLLTTNIQ